jgi:hypothetical protein
LAAIDETAPETPVLYVEGTSIPTDIRKLPVVRVAAVTTE